MLGRLVSPYKTTPLAAETTSLMEELGIENPCRTVRWDGRYFHTGPVCDSIRTLHRSEDRTVAEIYSTHCPHCWRSVDPGQALVATVFAISKYLQSIESLSLRPLSWRDADHLLEALSGLELAAHKEMGAPGVLKEKVAAAQARIQEALTRPEVARLVRDEILARYAGLDLSAPHAALAPAKAQNNLAAAATAVWGVARLRDRILVEAPSVVVSFLSHWGCMPVDVTGMTPSQKDTLLSLWEPWSTGPLADPHALVDVARSV